MNGRKGEQFNSLLFTHLVVVLGCWVAGLMVWAYGGRLEKHRMSTDMYYSVPGYR